jgi:cytochrome c6
MRRSGASLALLAALVLPVHAQTAPSGKQIFSERATPPCGLCHTLKAAGSAGTIGPNLDSMKPDSAKVSRAVKNGVGNMPPYGDTLSDAEIEAVSEYVAAMAAASK